MIDDGIIISKLKEVMNAKRLQHTLNTRDAAVQLAEHYHCDVDKVKVAALLHDYCKGMPIEMLNEKVLAYEMSSIYYGNAAISHAKIAAKLVEEEFGIKDEEVLNAISYHTTGREYMPLMEKIIFIADMIEPLRTYDGIEEVRELAFIDLDLACLRALDHIIVFIIKQEKYLHTDTVLARNYFQLKVIGGANG